MPDIPSSPEAAWGTCRFCGDAAPPGSARCPTCGSEATVIPGAPGTRSLPARVRHRLYAHRGLRMLVISGGVIALAYFLAGAVISGPPSYPDPLTGHWARAIPAGGTVTLAGWITGEDYVTGNFSVVAPPGAMLGFAIYNASEFRALGQGPAGTTAAQSTPASSGGRIVFAAPYTDTYYLVWKNPYPAASAVSVTVYVSIEYRSNVVLG